MCCISGLWLLKGEQLESPLGLLYSTVLVLIVVRTYVLFARNVLGTLAIEDQGAHQCRRRCSIGIKSYL